MELFRPEEVALWSVTLITEPAVSPFGQIMTIARDRDCNVQRLLLESDEQRSPLDVKQVPSIKSLRAM